ncbi:hypothetical protein [Thiobacillus sp.]|uniref:hypothetical protein n=1 Tax=Thiobacillus sp. TaxID=924 RepID=UPI0025F978DF|nr:hypothetical protein [Thiobacillus sp.]
MRVACPLPAVRREEQAGEQEVVGVVDAHALRCAILMQREQALGFILCDKRLVRGLLGNDPLRPRAPFHRSTGILLRRLDLAPLIPDRIAGIGERVTLNADEGRHRLAPQAGVGSSHGAGNASGARLKKRLDLHRLAFVEDQGGLAHGHACAHCARLMVLQRVSERCAAASAKTLADVRL